MMCRPRLFIYNKERLMYATAFNFQDLSMSSFLQDTPVKKPTADTSVLASTSGIRLTNRHSSEHGHQLPIHAQPFVMGEGSRDSMIFGNVCTNLSNVCTNLSNHPYSVKVIVAIVNTGTPKFIDMMTKTDCHGITV